MIGGDSIVTISGCELISVTVLSTVSTYIVTKLCYSSVKAFLTRRIVLLSYLRWNQIQVNMQGNQNLEKYFNINPSCSRNASTSASSKQPRQNQNKWLVGRRHRLLYKTARNILSNLYILPCQWIRFQSNITTNKEATLSYKMKANSWSQETSSHTSHWQQKICAYYIYWTQITISVQNTELVFHLLTLYNLRY